MTPSHLTLSDLERSKSRSLRFWVVGDLYYMHIFASSLLSPSSGCHRRDFVGGWVFPLSQRSFLFHLFFERFFKQPTTSKMAVLLGFAGLSINSVSPRHWFYDVYNWYFLCLCLLNQCCGTNLNKQQLGMPDLNYNISISFTHILIYLISFVFIFKWILFSGSLRLGLISSLWITTTGIYYICTSPVTVTMTYWDMPRSIVKFHFLHLC